SYVNPTPPRLPALFSNDPPPTETSTLSLHDALPISAAPEEQVLAAAHDGGRRRRRRRRRDHGVARGRFRQPREPVRGVAGIGLRSEEHTSELQSLTNLVCRLLLGKKNTKQPPARYAL